MAKYVRSIVKIDEEKCDGCGLCIPGCAEGAMQIIDGKARLVSDDLCDGLGNCLGTCPQGAITIEERDAEAFDEAAVQAMMQAQTHVAGSPSPEPSAPCACPGSLARKLAGAAPAGSDASPSADDGKMDAPRPSRLGHWPVQLHLLPPVGEIWDRTDVLIAADCVAFAMPDFHERLLAGKTLAIGCPKLDDASFYAEKLSAIFANNNINSVTVAHMVVPCCSGLVMVVKQALAAAGKTDMELRDLTIDVDGTIQREMVADLQ